MGGGGAIALNRLNASIVLYYCNMKTLYLRNVPDDVVDRLKALAERENLSVSSMAVRELTESTRRALNPGLLGTLPNLDIGAEEVLAALDEGRRGS